VSYLGRLVDRAVGPPAAAVSPRLAPVFPIGRAAPPEPEPESFGADTFPHGAVAQSRRSPPAQPRRNSAETPQPSIAQPKPEIASLPTARVESPVREPQPEPVDRIEAPAPEPHRVETRVHERTVERSPARLAVEPTRPTPPKAPTVAAARVARDPVPLARRDRASAQESARIEVRIGRVEVRRPSAPDPIEWPPPAADAPPVAGVGGTGFGELAASRRYVDRRWS
jgi:hypothetical protein